jgi:hypothetical protein
MGSVKAAPLESSPPSRLISAFELAALLRVVQVTRAVEGRLRFFVTREHRRH